MKAVSIAVHDRSDLGRQLKLLGLVARQREIVAPDLVPPGHPHRNALPPHVRGFSQRVRPHHRLHVPAQQRQIHPQELAVVPGVAFSHLVNVAQQGNGRPDHLIFQPRHGIDGIAGINGGQRQHRVVGKRKPQIFPFPFGLFLVGHIGLAVVQFQQGPAGSPVHLFAKHGELSGIAVACFLLRHRPDAVQGSQHGGAAPQRVEGSRLGQGLQRAPVQTRYVHPAAEITNGGIGAVGLALGHDGRDGSLPHRLDGSQANVQGIRSVRPFGGSVGGVVHSRTVHVRQPDPDPHARAFIYRCHVPVRVVQPAVEHRCHVLQRMVGFEIRRPVGNQRVADAVSLVEGVTRERLDEVENLGAHRLRVSPLNRSRNEPVTLLGHQRGNLLAHGLADGVGLPQRVTGEVLQDVQHLVLVDDDAVGLVQQFLHAGMGIRNLLHTMFGADESVDVLHGAGPIEGDHRRNIPQVRRFQLLNIALHTGAFQLEQVGGVARAQQRVGFRVVQRQPAQVDADPLFRIQQFDGAVQDRQVGEAEEIHLQQPELGHRVHRELGHHHRTVLIAAGRPLQRNCVC